jgi:hypothetical protein
MRDPRTFQEQWAAQNYPKGAEQHVYFEPDTNRYIKRNHMGYHDTWLQFFQRTIAHNFLFTPVAYTLEGFMDVADRDGNVLLMPLITQRAVQGRGGAQEEVSAYMRECGFEQRKHAAFVSMGLTDSKWDRYHLDHGLIVYDLHPKNVIITAAGNFAIIDPLIELDPETKLARMRRRYGL